MPAMERVSTADCLRIDCGRLSGDALDGLASCSLRTALDFFSIFIGTGLIMTLELRFPLVYCVADSFLGSRDEPLTVATFCEGEDYTFCRSLCSKFLMFFCLDISFNYSYCFHFFSAYYFSLLSFFLRWLRDRCEMNELSSESHIRPKDLLRLDSFLLEHSDFPSDSDYSSCPYSSSS